MSVPTQISYTDSDINTAASRRVLRPGGYAFVVTSVDRAETKKGHMMLKCTVAPLKDPSNGDSTASPTARHNLFVPIKNPTVEDHEAPNTLGLCHSFLRAIEWDGESGTIPPYPRFDGAAKTWSLDGEDIDEKEAKTARHDAAAATIAAMVDIWNGPDTLKRYAFKAESFINGSFVNLRNFASSGEDLVDRDGNEIPLVEPTRFAMVLGEDGDESEASGEDLEEAPAPVRPNGRANSKGKPAAKMTKASPKSRPGRK